MIYINGASDTYGDDLENPATQAWPYLLGKLMNKPVTNNALRGNSYEHIVFDTINYCSDTKPNLVIIAFGPISRKFFVRRENNYTVDISLLGCNSIYSNASEFKKFRDLLFKYWSNYLYDSWKFLQTVVLLQSFLKERNIDYRLLNASDHTDILKLLDISNQTVDEKKRLLDAFDNFDDDQIHSLQKQLTNIFCQIDPTYYYKFEWSFKNIVNYDLHPSKEDHRSIAQFIFENIV